MPVIVTIVPTGPEPGLTESVGPPGVSVAPGCSEAAVEVGVLVRAAAIVAIGGADA